MERNKVLIEADELLKKLGNENIRIYDASIVDEMYQQGHIPGAAFFSHEKFSDPSNAYEYMLLPRKRPRTRGWVFAIVGMGVRHHRNAQVELMSSST